MITHEEKMNLRTQMYKHAMILMEKIQKMLDAGNLTQSQMEFAADVLKDLSSADKNLSKACYYDSSRGSDADRTY